MIKSKTSLLALVTLATSALATVSQAATNGDLVLAFQNPGGTTGASSTLLLDIGSPATLRDSFGTNTNLGTTSTISANFGATWYDTTTLWVSAVGVWKDDPGNGSALLNGDPANTIYISKARATAGTVGTQNSSGFTTSAAEIESATSAIRSTIATGSSTYFSGSSVVGNTATYAVGTGGKYLVDNNPTSGQQQSYQAFSYNVQQQFTAGSLFNFGSISNVEAALDIYRVQYDNTVPGQYGSALPSALSAGGDPFGAQYIGTITLSKHVGDSSITDINFITAVPEPSTYAMLGLVAAIFGFVIIRRKLSVSSK